MQPYALNIAALLGDAGLKCALRTCETPTAQGHKHTQKNEL